MKADYMPPFATEGKIEDYPIPVLITLLLDQKMTGMLYLETEGQKPWIFFSEGFPAGVLAPKAQDFLGQVLRELNYIDDATFNASLMAMAKTKRMQGQILLEMQKINDEQLERALSMQIARKLSRLFAIKSGTFKFAEDEDLPPPLDPIRVNPFALIYNGIKNSYNEDDLKKGLAGMVGKACKVSGLFIERKDLFEFPKEDMEDAELLRDFRLPQEFVRGAKCGTVAAMMMLLALQYCGRLEFEDPAFAQPMPGARAPATAAQPRPAVAQPGAAASTRPGPAGSRPGAPAAHHGPGAKGGPKVSADLRKKINDKFEEVKTANLWHILEVEPNATSEVIKKSFLVLAKVYHPDRIAGSDEEELTNRMDVIASKLNEAYATLVDPERRFAYEKKVANPEAGTGPRPEEAKIQFGKAMVYLKKKDILKAAEGFRWAADLDPKNGDYQAYRYWADLMKEEGDEHERTEKAKVGLQEVLKNFPNCFHAARFLSLIYMKANDEANYAQYLTKAAKLNSKDVEVAREMRLLSSRKEKDEQRGKFLGIKFIKK